MIPIPARVAEGIDKIAGSKKRTAFIVEVLEREIRRREQLEALAEAVGSWKDKDHPELVNGGDVWVRQMRDESLKRFEKIERHRKSH